MDHRKKSEMLWQAALDKQDQKQLLRHLHHAETQKPDVFLDFTSNDYLGLSSHPKVIAGAIQALKDHGIGKCSSRLIGGGYSLIDEFEKELALWYGKEKALVFPSGYQANISFLSALLKPSSLVIADKYIHKSLIDGIKLSGAKLIRYPHANIKAMESLLKKNHTKFSEIICLTESVFSMHGTVIDLNHFCDVSAHFKALSCVDDAHGFGVLEKDEKSRTDQVDIVMTTLSKTLGIQGGAVLGSKRFIDYLVNFSSGFIYTTSLSPAIVGGALAAIQLLPFLSREKKNLLSLSFSFTKRLENMGITSSSSSQIKPIYVGSAEKALLWQKILKENKISVVAIRPPTVPVGQSLLRFSLSSKLSETSLNILFCQLEKLLCQY